MTSIIKLRILGVVIASIILGLMLVPVVDRVADLVREAYDLASPIATLSAERMPSPPGETILRLRSTKHRPWELLTLQAFEGSVAGWKRIQAARADGEAISSLPPGTVIREALWRVWPTTTGPLMLLLVYDADGRVVRIRVDVP